MSASLPSKSGCRGGAPAAAGCLRAPERGNAAVPHRNDRQGPMITLDEAVDVVEALARVHGDKSRQRHPPLLAARDHESRTPFTPTGLLLDLTPPLGVGGASPSANQDALRQRRRRYATLP